MRGGDISKKIWIRHLLCAGNDNITEADVQLQGDACRPQVASKSHAYTLIVSIFRDPLRDDAAGIERQTVRLLLYPADLGDYGDNRINGIACPAQ